MSSLHMRRKCIGRLKCLDLATISPRSRKLLHSIALSSVALPPLSRSSDGHANLVLRYARPTRRASHAPFRKPPNAPRSHLQISTANTSPRNPLRREKLIADACSNLGHGARGRLNRATSLDLTGHAGTPACDMASMQSPSFRGLGSNFCLPSTR
ncbi:hypothetical protein C7974DRAFT_151814 [Boeremia exigua]|uniref:uncharacterized protein n=1 Tax=Boeremia exigua TaxID=749465 RepID=UPI001E8CBC5B|nr:uncharacterized protein C7974DRAFT_151814 [Boeremia exigua]KAH6637983.1 hypothetical protein C7974DRAFT_151814 [Boeremia exigua]